MLLATGPRSARGETQCGTDTIRAATTAIVAAAGAATSAAGGTTDRDWNTDRDPRDVLTRDLDLPSGRDRQQVHDRERVYAIDGAESRELAPSGAFPVVAESDLYDIVEAYHYFVRFSGRELTDFPLYYDARSRTLRA